MVSRSGFITTPQRQEKRPSKKQATGRRQMNVPIRAGNAEIRLPVLALPRLGGRGFAFVVVVALGLALFWMMNSPAYSATEDRILVDGLERVDNEMLLAKSGILNQPVFLVSPDEVKDSLTKDVPALDSVEVSVKFNGTVVVEAVERVPVLIWDQEGIPQASWVDIGGRLFPVLGSADNLIHVSANGYPPVPPQLLVASSEDEQEEEVVTSEEIDKDKGREQLLNPVLVPNILMLARSLPKDSQLVYDHERGFGWEDPTYNWMVYFGKQLEQPGLRVKIYEEIAAMFEQKQHKPVLISVEYIHAPYYRMEP
jgi:hypothetical protein